MKYAIADDDENEIANGTYYILNQYSRKYVFCPQPSVGSLVKQWTYGNIYSQQWVLNKTSDGYYTMYNNATNLYLSVENNSNQQGANIVVSDSATSDGSKWNIEWLYDNVYELSAKCSGLKLCLDPTAYDTHYNSDGVTLSQGNFSARYDNRWYFYKVSNDYHISPSFDTGYLDRYLTLNVSRSRINDAMLRLNQFYLERFGTYISYPYTAQNISSYADNCSLNYDSDCTHGTCTNSYYTNTETLVLNNYHHTNITNVLYRMPTPTNIIQFNVVFTGRELCYMNGNTHYSYFAYGVTAPDLRTVIIDDFVSAVHESTTLIHEVGHMFGAPDHYYRGETKALNDKVGQNIFHDDCIYGANKERSDIRENATMCRGCYESIYANIKK